MTNKKQENKTANKEVEKALATAAILLNSLVNPGATLELCIRTGKVIVPGTPLQGKESRLIIHKPIGYQVLNIQRTGINGDEPGD